MATVIYRKRRPALLGLALLLVGCPAPTNQATATIDVVANPRFSTQATLADVDHYTFKLYPYDTGTDTMGSLLASHARAGSGTKAHFSNVPTGIYKVTCEAFSSTDDSVSITLGGPQRSFNVAKVNTSGVTYVPGGVSLRVGLVLTGGSLAPGDTGSTDVIHTFTVTKPQSTPPFTPVVSSFVWIPRFTAYQLLVPPNCGNEVRNGVPDSSRPIGFWVRTRPLAGVEEADWVSATFGGFYAGAFEASHDDATSTIPGNGSALSVRQNVIPWGTVDWHRAMTTCALYDSHCALMGDAEWTALAVWTMIHFVPVHGNSQGGVSFDNTNIGFTADPSMGGRALTGSGQLLPSGGGPWPSGVNLTTHTGTPDGVYDLDGNVSEWSRNVGISASGAWTVNGADMTAMVPAPGYVATLETRPEFRLLGLTKTISSVPVTQFGKDTLLTGQTDTMMVRGGHYNTLDRSGVWFQAFNSGVVTNYVGAEIGFRPMLKY